eukprot:1755088-Pleurochrysis_carterae.AAC.3
MDMLSALYTFLSATLRSSINYSSIICSVGANACISITWAGGQGPSTYSTWPVGYGPRQRRTARHGAMPSSCEGRYLQVPLGDNGFNNQRTALMTAAVFARVLNRTLVMPEWFGQNKHAMPCRTDAIYDYQRLGEIVPLVKESSFRKSCAVGGASVASARAMVGYCCDVSATGIVSAQQRNDSSSNAKQLIVSIPWSWGAPYLDVSFDQTWYALALSIKPDFFSCASAIVDGLLSEGSRTIHSMHFRAGDMSSSPLLDCGKCMLLTDDLTQACIHPNTNTTAVLRDSLECALKHRQIVPGDALYVATNKPELLPSLERTLRSVVQLRLFSWQSNETQVYAKRVLSCRRLGIGRPDHAVPDTLSTVVSLLEQIVASQAPGRFFGVLRSTWDELVLRLRSPPRLLSHRGANATATSRVDGQQLELFEHKARLMDRQALAVSLAYPKGHAPGYRKRWGQFANAPPIEGACRSC